MGISYNAQERVFRLDTPHSTYLIGIVDDEGFLGHVYYGKRIPDDNMRYLLRVTGEVRSGAAWMHGGMPLPKMKSDFLGKLMVLEAVAV